MIRQEICKATYPVAESSEQYRLNMYLHIQVMNVVKERNENVHINTARQRCTGIDYTFFFLFFFWGGGSAIPVHIAVVNQSVDDYVHTHTHTHLYMCVHTNTIQTLLRRRTVLLS